MINRDTITEKLKERLEPLPFVHAFWLEGADANETVDEYSDLDYWIDIDDASEVQAFEAVKNALKELSDMDYQYIMKHDHPQIRQRIYHLKNTSEYLLIDFCAQLHSRPKEEYVYCEDDKIEVPKVVFDKDGIIRYKPLNLSDFSEWNRSRLEEAKYRRTQHIRAEKYVRRGQYLEAYAYYNRYVLEPLIDLLRLIYTPAHANYYLIHISQHIPEAQRKRLEYFAQIGTLEDMAEKIPQAGQWFDELIVGLDNKECCIRPLSAKDLQAYAQVIRQSFSTVAKELGLTRENCPTHTSFITDERLSAKLKEDYFPFGYFADGKLVGFVSLTDMGNGVFEMDNLAVLPDCRRLGYGRELLDYCKEKVCGHGGSKITIGIIEENTVLKNWYAANGFVHTGTKKFKHLPFAVGFMEWRTNG